MLHMGSPIVIEDLGGANGTFVNDRAHPDAPGKTEKLRRLVRETAEVAVGEGVLLGAVSVVVRHLPETMAAGVIIGDANMRTLYLQAERAAASLINVLLLGETASVRRSSRARFTPARRAPRGPLWVSTARRSARTCWKASCSGMKRARSLAPFRPGRGFSRPPAAEPSSWTKSASSRFRPRKVSARAPGARRAQDRRARASACRRALRGGDQPGHRDGGSRRSVPRRSLLSAERDQLDHPAAAGTARRNRGARAAPSSGAPIAKAPSSLPSAERTFRSHISSGNRATVAKTPLSFWTGRPRRSCPPGDGPATPGFNDWSVSG